MDLHVLKKEMGNKLRHDFSFETDASIRSALNLLSRSLMESSSDVRKSLAAQMCYTGTTCFCFVDISNPELLPAERCSEADSDSSCPSFDVLPIFSSLWFFKASHIPSLFEYLSSVDSFAVNTCLKS